MAYTGYRVLKAPIDQIETMMDELIGDGWQPLGAPTLTYPNSNMVYQAIVQGTPDGGGGGPVTIVVNDITDATDTGKAVLLADDEEAARAAIGAGTGNSNLALGTTASTAKAGNYHPTWAQVTSKPAVIGAGETEAAARQAIGAGTSSLALGTSASQASAGNHNHAVTADTGSGLAAAANIQALAVALSTRIKVLEDAPVE